MRFINSTNVNYALPAGLRLLNEFGRTMDSRVGQVVVLDEPVTTRYMFPQERVLFDPQRDANPFFHLFEALWMLDGRQDLAFLEYLLPRFRDFSDDGVTLHGAYGYRWRHWPYGGVTSSGEVDQLYCIIRMLKTNTSDRRVVLQMWDPVRDLGRNSKDIPCNDMVKFRVIHGRLDMYVFNRSNDIVLGAYGANAVHFSFLQEYIAQMVGVEVGAYEQISCDYHMYTSELKKQWPPSEPLDFYKHKAVTIHPLVTAPDMFDVELFEFLEHFEELKEGMIDGYTYANAFFTNIAIPMLEAFAWYKDKKEPALAAVLLEERIARTERFDWLHAGWLWLMRRANRQVLARRAVTSSPEFP